MLVKEEVFYQGTPITVSRMKTRHCREPWTSQTLRTQGSALLYKHCTADTQYQTHKSHQVQQKHMCCKCLSLMRLSQKTFVYKVTIFKVVHRCQCTLFKPLHSGIDVTVSKGCVSLSVSRQQIQLRWPWMCKCTS